MNRRYFLIAGGLLIAVTAAVVGVVVAVGQGGDDSKSGPTGEQTLLRVQADSQATCGGTVVASIFLDDLESRASAYDDALEAGLVAFELPLVYDSAVLQIGDASNIVLNDALDEVDSDGDGVTRNWLPASYINDGEGWAMVASTSYNTDSTGGDENREEGIVPSADSGPHLLATVRFSVIGEGIAAVTIEGGEEGPFQRGPIKLFDPQTEHYEDAEVTGANVEVSGGDCAAVETSTPIPTRAPVATMAIPPTRVIPSPEWLTPTPASDTGRPDCPSEWAGYTGAGGRISLCYPKELEAIEATPGSDLGVVLTLNRPGVGTVVTMYSRPSSYFATDDTSRCTVAPGWRDAGEVKVEILGRTVASCRGYEQLLGPGVPDLLGTFAEVPLSEDAYVSFFWYAPQGEGFEDEAAVVDDILATLVLVN